ncbi:MAG TPA: hypothetical protein VI112_03485 [Bacteroidia bacterium]|jgi:hypothetical protein
MKTTVKKIVPAPGPARAKKIKVRLDYRTIIVLKNLSQLDMWKKKYPKAKVMAA